MRHSDGTFNHQIFDPDDFLACTFNDIRPDDINEVLMNFNVWLDNDLIPRFVTSIEFDGCDDINIICDDGFIAQADSSTTMDDIIRQLRES